MVKVSSITRTCEACPAQWEGETEDGSSVYVRYRWGRLKVEVDGMPVFGPAPIGGPLDGSMTYDQLKRHLAGFAELPDCEVFALNHEVQP